MPFKSKAQMRYMFSQHPEMAKEWAEHTPKNKKLPNRKNGKKSPSESKRRSK